MVAEVTHSSRRTGVAVALLVAGVYAYFLLFSQFAFLEIVQSAGFEEMRIKAVLGTMALGGVWGAISVQRRKGIATLRTALLVCGMAALGVTLAHSLGSLLLISFAMGVALGSVTVSLAAMLPQWLSREQGCWYVGIGTGLGYALCNVPAVFLATPQQQCRIAAVFALVAFAASWLLREERVPSDSEQKTSLKIPIFAAVLVFLAFVWMDSGAFYVIQHAPDLKKATWGEHKLWINAGLHFFSALVAGWLLARGYFRFVLGCAAIILGAAAFWVNDISTRTIAGYGYPIAVSFYSTALVCWPGLLSGKALAWRRAAWVFAIAGWIGSGLGIGMVENLQRVPLWFVLVACSVIFWGLLGGMGKRSWMPLVGIAAVFVLEKISPQAVAPTAIERGRQVYVAEGCIHCHSQYLRPGSVDESLWGEPIRKDKVLAGQPVLIGNRRQGPDLTHVAGRRSQTWLRMHFLAPRDLAPDSVMPSYAHLFDDKRGEDLIAYLSRDRGEDITAVQTLIQAWQPEQIASEDLVLGKNLYTKHCAACHGNEGKGDGFLAAKLQKAPANLAQGPWTWSAKREGESEAISIARVVRFGIPGTDMPGHETWTLEQLQAVTNYLLQWRKPGS